MRVLVGLSGGVDSAVAAYLLQTEGHEVIGATMSIWDKEQVFKTATGKEGCFSPHEEEDIKHAQEICQILNIPYHVFDCTEQYKKTVLQNFKEEYLNGRTPNPCIICNSSIKFNTLPTTAKQNGLEFDKFATGHYTRLSYDNLSNRYKIQTAIDKNKDQSYFLYRLTQQQLSQILLPLGNFTKAEIRKIAEEANFPISHKADSQDFYTGDINDIIQATPKIGNFVTQDGTILGQHQGIWNYTIGQRRGLGISAPKPLYVIGLNKEKNEVILGFDDEAYKNSLIADNLAWLSCSPLTQTTEVMAKVRSSQKPIKALITPLDEYKIKVEFIEPQKALTPGQSIVLYDNDEYVLGGGFIKETI